MLRRAAWVVVAALFVAACVSLPVYAVRASGEPLGFGLMVEAVFGTRVGRLWLLRLGLAVLTAALISWALRDATRGAARGGLARWLPAAVCAGALVSTLTLQSHAATQSRLLPLAMDWAHATAASVWVGGLLGFPLVLLGALRGVEPGLRNKLLRRSVRRFTTLATITVAVLVITGTYAALLHLSGPQALVASPYGRALVMKLGMVLLMFPIAAINLYDRGDGPFDRMVGAELVLALGVFVATGFLTTLPPA